MDLLKGKLTYIVAGVGLVWALTGYFMGWLPQDQALQIAWSSLAVFGIRRAIN